MALLITLADGSYGPAEGAVVWEIPDGWDAEAIEAWHEHGTGCADMIMSFGNDECFTVYMENLKER